MNDTATTQEKCFACGRKLVKCCLVDTRDGQEVFVGMECYRKIMQAGDTGYQPPRGGPRLYPLPAHEMDFADYVQAKGGTYLPFPAAVEFCYCCEWSVAMWEALIAGIRPPAHRVAELLKRNEHLKSYLPPEIAVDYPTVENPYLPPSQ